MKTVVLLILLLLSKAILMAQEEKIPGSSDPLKVSKISESIVFDGIPDEDFWQTIETLPLIMLAPVSGNVPTEETTLKIAYDHEYFYVSGILKYKDPVDIRAIGKKRDYSSSSTDWFGCIMDTFNDRENAVSFWTNPNGLRCDATVKNDAINLNSDINFSWNTFWDVKTVMDEHGWSAEFRIPFSSLRFQSYQGKTLMGIILVRYISAKYEMLTFPAVSPDYSAAYWKPSLSSVIEFEGLNPRKVLYIAPYVTAGIGQVNKLNKAETAYKMNSTPKFDAGLDLKYSLTNNLTADLTMNTDFAQVEADDQKINLTRYSLYFPEKRIFFLEKSDVFDFSFLQGNNLFYSRRIGLYEGNPVRIYGGLRLTGRTGKWDVGILDMQTASYEENPGENFGVIRSKRTVFNPNSYVGGMVTSRLGTDGTYNVAYGLDGQFRVTGDEYLTMRWAQTFETGSDNTLFNLAPSRFLFEWQRRKITGLAYDMVYTWSGKSFNPGIGFETKEDYHGTRTILRYGWLPESDIFIRYHYFSLSLWNIWNTATGSHETTNAEVDWYFEAKKGFYGDITASWHLENLQDTLTLGNDQAYVPPGKYTFSNLSVSYSTSTSHDLSASFSVDAGSFYDGRKLSFYANPKAKIGASFDLGLTYSLDYVDFSSRSIDFTNHIVGIKGLMTLTTSTSLAAFVQYNTAINKVITNIRFRFNPREGNDFYIVYDEGLNTGLEREDPELLRSTGRTILLKYTYTFKL